MSIAIRSANVNDIDALSAMIFRSKKSNGYDDAFMEACRAELRVTETKLAEWSFWVAKDTSLLGCAAMAKGADDKTGEIHAFFIAPEAKRQGVGRALWAIIQKAARGKGWHRLTLDADPGAVGFYEAMGFSVIGESPSGSIPGRMIPLMAIDLTPSNPPNHAG
ncbi:MAG: GNAT family N-acetyltransferase [Pikeienuella sp.]